ncbi:glycosyltransferase family 39 protein [Granulicella sp. S156]|uniref:ArnT family glycosyltransferase n=1 Tax=Granulicella sp. S156 TaxID=1747224 RepID=UPI00131C46D5|nr:glycosyltransferase family 39 protein [Granulicella sp. S156]
MGDTVEGSSEIAYVRHMERPFKETASHEPSDAIPLFGRDLRCGKRVAFFSAALASVLACFVLLPLLGHRPLTSWDEGIYAEVSREMLSSGWLVPHWNAQLWFVKPPLMMWITAVFFKLFGVGEFWARAGSAFSGVATVGLLHGWLALRQSRLTAWLSSLLLLSNFGFQHASRAGEVDMLLTLGCLLALIGLAELQEEDWPGRHWGWYLFWGGFAIAVMTKGAASIVLVFTLLFFAVMQRRIWKHGGKAFVLGLALFLAVVAPWHVYMIHRFGSEFLGDYLGYQVLQRAATAIEGHVTHAWYYLGVLLVSAPFFSLLFPSAIAGAFRRPEMKSLRVFAVFSLVVIVFFSAVKTRLPHYIAPAYPALAALTAAWLAAQWRRFSLDRKKASVRVSIVAAAVVAYIACTLITIGPRKQLHSPMLSNGLVTGDNKDAVLLLRSVFRHPQPIQGPLLVWNQARFVPIPSSIFYAQRPVQQVTLQPVPPGTPVERYLFDPEPLSEAMANGPRLLLLDRTLVPEIPADYTYSPIQAQGSVEIGSIVRTK